MRDGVRGLVRPGLALTGLLWVLAPVPGAAVADEWSDEEPLPVEVHGFAEGAFSSRITEDQTQSDDFVLSEARFRLDLMHEAERGRAAFKVDFISDGLRDELEIDVREARVSFRAAEWLDVRAGRQVLTWGTGDFVFLNDLFPKDFVSFFIGRADEFLKAPSNSLKLTFYSPAVDLDVVWTPVFAPDRFITGERLSFFDVSKGRVVSAETLGGPLEATSPSREFRNGELAARLSRTIGGYELALYGYSGFSKQPTAFDTLTATPEYSRLGVYGASVRGTVFGGVANVEGAFYLSTQDRDGTDPNVPNSQMRGLVGYERELIPNLTGGLQYYAERTGSHDELLAHSPSPQLEPEEVRHQITTRLTWRLLQQTLDLSFFAFFAPQEGDTHLRPALTYKWSDALTLVAGANIMWGDDHTFFGQLENNSNAYTRIRYSF